jgi:hypothetical protein
MKGSKISTLDKIPEENGDKEKPLVTTFPARDWNTKDFLGKCKFLNFII